MKKIVSLKNLAEVHTAVVFRDGPPIEDQSGNARALAIRDLVRNRAVNWRELTQVRIDAKLLRSCLVPGDVVLPSRGDRYCAWHFEGADENIFPLGHVSVIRVNAALDSRYLSWYLNRSDTQAQITGLLTGTNIKALTKTTLLNIQVKVPTLEVQQKIARLDSTGARLVEIRSRINDLEMAEIAYLTDGLLDIEEAEHD
jgi:Type I restriction modification DNA specificity domain